MPKYKEFSMDNIFNFSSSKAIYHANHVFVSKTKESSEYYRYIVRTSQNNGIRGYIAENIDGLNPANTISFAQDTAEFFYQTEPYFTGNKVKILSLKHYQLNSLLSLYLITAMNKAFVQFGWSTSFNVDVLKQVLISLPVDNYDRPNWEYMTEYIQKIQAKYVKQIQAKYVKQIQAYLAVISDATLDASKTQAILQQYRQSDFKEFRIGDLFEIATTKAKFNAQDVFVSKQQLDDTYFPYVVRTSFNNGIRGYINENQSFLNEGNTISLAQDTAEFFYQKYPYFTGDKIKVMKLLNYSLTPLLAEYLLTAIRKAFTTFTWGSSSFNISIIKSVQLKLPVNNSGKPDYELMRDYIKVIQQKYVDKLQAQLQQRLSIYQSLI